MSRVRGALACMLAWLVVCLALDERRLPGVAYADFGITATIYVVGTILSGLFGLFGGRRVDPQIGRAVEGLRAGVTDLGRELVNVAQRLGGAIVAALGLFGRFIGRSFGPLFRALGNMWTRLLRFIDKLFGPIINFLMRIRDWVQRFYQRFIRPIVDAIEIARRVLRLLSLFGMDWAKKLDEKLYTIEQYFTAPIEFLTAKINEALGWINRIVTLDGLLQRVTLIKSLVRDANALANIWWQKTHRNLTPAERAEYGRTWGGADVPQAVRDAEAYIVHRQGPDRAVINEHVADIRLRLSRAGVI